MTNMPVFPVIEDPLSTDAEPASHPARPRTRDRGRRRGAAVAGPLSSAPPASPGSTSTRRRSTHAQELADRFGWHPLDVEDVMSKRQRPKVDDYADEGYLFDVLHFPVYDRAIQRLNAAELDVFVGPDYLVTLPTVELLPVTRLFRPLRGGRARSASSSSRRAPAGCSTRCSTTSSTTASRSSTRSGTSSTRSRTTCSRAAPRRSCATSRTSSRRSSATARSSSRSARPCACSSATSSGSCRRSSSSTSTTSSTPPSASGTSSTTTRRSSRRSRTRTSR